MDNLSNKPNSLCILTTVNDIRIIHGVSILICGSIILLFYYYLLLFIIYYMNRQQTVHIHIDPSSVSNFSSYHTFFLLNEFSDIIFVLFSKY